MISKLRMTAMATALLAVLVIAGCGSSSSSSSSSSTESTSSGSTESTSSGGGESADAANIAKAKELVAKYEKTSGVSWPKPTEPFEPGSGKLAVIDCGSSGTDCLEGAKEVQVAAKAMGWTPSPILDGEFNPSKQAGYVQQAIQEGYNGIVLISIDAQSIKSAVDAAAAKGIPIACVMCVNPAFKGKVYDASSGGIEGKAIGDWIVANSTGKSKILAFDDKSFPIVAVRRGYAEEQIEELCPECEIDNTEFPTTDLEKPGSPTFEAELAANPPGSLEFVIAPYDPAAIPMLKAAEQEGREDFKMTGWDASLEFLEAIKAGGGVAEADSASPFPYADWSAVDLVGRLATGHKAWTADRMPSALVTKNNVAELIKTGGYFRPPDFDFESMFRELWGKE